MWHSYNSCPNHHNHKSLKPLSPSWFLPTRHLNIYLKSSCVIPNSQVFLVLCLYRYGNTVYTQPLNIPYLSALTMSFDVDCPKFSLSGCLWALHVHLLLQQNYPSSLITSLKARQTVLICSLINISSYDIFNLFPQGTASILLFTSFGLLQFKFRECFG